MNKILPRIANSGQAYLFPVSPREVCKRIGLPWWAAVKLYEDKLISFNPEEIHALSEGQEAELCFIGALVVCDCSSDILSDLLATLESPYEYQHSRIYYDWPSKRWCELPEQEDPETIFYEWTTDLLASEDIETLEKIKEHVSTMLDERK